MIIIPDLFTPYVEGVETARRANWDDLNNYNQVQKGQLDNMFNFATFSPRVNREYEETDKVALQNLFNEEAFQSKLLQELYNAERLRQQAANYARQAAGVGLRGGSRSGNAAGTTGTTGTTNSNGTVGKQPGMPGLTATPNTTTKSKDGVQWTPMQQQLNQQFGLTGNGSLTSYQLLRNGQTLEDFNPAGTTFNTAELSKLPMLRAGRSNAPIDAGGGVIVNPNNDLWNDNTLTNLDEIYGDAGSYITPEQAAALGIGQLHRSGNNIVWRDDRNQFYTGVVQNDGNIYERTPIRFNAAQ